METLTRDEYFPNADSVVSILARSPQTYFPEHVHEFDELVIVRSGSGMNYINGRPTPICRGSVFYTRANQTHFLPLLRFEWVRICDGGIPRQGVKGGRSPAKRTLDALNREIRWRMAGCSGVVHPAMKTKAVVI